jgi:hypothetical protein
MADQETEIDPEFFDVLLQSLSILSNVAMVATTWAALTRTPNVGNTNVIDDLRAKIRDLRRSFEDCFESVDRILRIHEQAWHRAGKNLLEQQPKFGSGTLLVPLELTQLNGQLTLLEAHAREAREAARYVQHLLQQTVNLGGQNIEFDVEAFNVELNSILFESRNFGEAMEKLRIASQKADSFIAQLYTLTNRRN